MARRSRNRELRRGSGGGIPPRHRRIGNPDHRVGRLRGALRPRNPATARGAVRVPRRRRPLRTDDRPLWNRGGRAEVRLARLPAGRGAELPHQGRGAPVHRSARRAQAQRAAPAPDRRPGLAAGGAALPQAHRDRGVAAGLDGRQARRARARRQAARRFLPHRRPARDRRLRGRTGHHGGAGGRRARPRDGRTDRLPRTGRGKQCARGVDVVGRQRRHPRPFRVHFGLLPRGVRRGAGRVPVGGHRHRRRRGARRDRSARRLPHRTGEVPARARAPRARLGRSARRGHAPRIRDHRLVAR